MLSQVSESITSYVRTMATARELQIYSAKRTGGGVVSREEAQESHFSQGCAAGMGVFQT